MLTRLSSVYTCQKPQPSRCSFFLWDEEAKPREAAVLLNNSRSEPPPAPATPSKPIASTGYLTPQTGSRPRQQSPEFRTPYTPSKSSGIASAQARINSPAADSSTQDDSEEEFYDWPITDDEELSKAVDHASSHVAMPPPETPRKAVRTDIVSTPGKRKFGEVDAGDSAPWPTPVSAKKEDDVFATPATNSKSKNLFSTTSPQDTPTPMRFKDVTPSKGSDSSFAAEVFGILQSAKISLPSSVREKVKEACDKQSLYTHGVIRGRDVSRSLIAKKDEKIVELQGSIEALQAERETSRAVIRHLRKEIGTQKANGK